MSELNPKSPRNTPFDLVGVAVPISRNVQDSQSDSEILPDVASPKPATLGTRHSSRMRQLPRGLADFVTTPRSMAAKRKAERRAKQSHDQKQIRLGHQASYQSKYRAQETPEQKAAHAAAEAHRRAQETPEQLAIRLGKQAEYRVAETPEQKAALAAAKAHRRAQETPEQTTQRQKTDRVSHRTRSATRRQRANQDMEAFFTAHPEIPARTRGDYARAEEMQYELVRKEVARADATRFDPVAKQVNSNCPTQRILV